MSRAHYGQTQEGVLRELLDLADKVEGRCSNSYPHRSVPRIEDINRAIASEVPIGELDEKVNQAINETLGKDKE
jgi:hypothetical protein